METRITLRHIAKIAGVHFTTVGLALRNDPRINSKTIAKVQAVALKLKLTTNLYTDPSQLPLAKGIATLPAIALKPSPLNGASNDRSSIT